MKKIALIVTLAIIAFLTAAAQGDIYFSLHSDGEFYINGNKADTILAFPGSTAQQLYSKVKSSLVKIYNNPNVVLSENAPISISVSSFAKDWCCVNPTWTGNIWYSSYYKLIFHFKDGRMKIDAPIVDDKLIYHGHSSPLIFSFRKLIQSWTKNENSYKKNKKRIDVIEAYVNATIIQVVLDLHQNNTVDAEDW